MRLRPSVPVLVRSDGSLQVGLASPLVLPDLDPQQTVFVQSLESGVPPSPAEVRRHALLWRRLEDHGALVADAAPPAVGVRVHDPGPLGAAIVAAVIRLGGRAGFACDEPGERAGASLTRALGQLQRIAPRAVALGSHAATDLDVLIGVGVTPPVAHRLMACDRTHLVVTTDDAGLTVGPLVVPGEGACGTCADLARVDADPDHAWLAAQCSTRPPLVADAPLAVAAMLAAHACVTAGLPAGMAWRVPLIGEITRADVAPHPACRCGAAGPVGDAEAAERARLP